jgi:glycerol kinase
MTQRYILALDQGTTSSRAILYNDAAETVAVSRQAFRQYFPQPGWVEHDAVEIWETQRAVAREVIDKAGIGATDIAAIGISNQRETTIIWDRATGQPIHPAIVWQDRRTSHYCQVLRDRGQCDRITGKTGLLLDAYFSATKIHWLLEHVEGARARAEAGELAFGTVDSWLAWNLTGGKAHITDAGNASRTLLFNIHTLDWDPGLLDLFGVPAALLPTVVDSSGLLAEVDQEHFGAAIPLAGMAGDQQAAMFGQLCNEPGMVKCTYGTGCFLTMNIGEQPIHSRNRLLTSVAWKIGEQIHYELEGSVFMGGATLQWLRDGLQFFSDESESEALATSVDDCDGVVVVPALTGLGAPHWDEHARGTILGITRGTTRAHITRAALEGICYQVNDVIDTMVKDRNEAITELRVDGGATANNFMVQFQADISGIDVIRPANLETTALGAAYLAGLGAGLWTMEQLSGKWAIGKTFKPVMDRASLLKHLRQWQKGVQRAKHWTGD